MRSAKARSLIGGIAVVGLLLLGGCLNFDRGARLPPRSPSATDESREIEATSTAVPTVSRDLTHTPTPTSTPVPPPWASNLNVVALGIDRRPEAGKDWRTDTIILISIDRASKAVFMVSIPRDLWVSIPGQGEERLNAVDFLGERTKYPGGGFELVKRTIEENLGIPVDHCVRIDFEGFQKVVDVLDGIVVEVECPLEDWFPDPAEPGELKRMYVPAGSVEMDGELALQYVRTRRGTGDFDRARRQQKVLLAVRDKALRLDVIPRIPALWRSFEPSIQTDLGLAETLELARLGAEIDLADIRGLVIDLSMAEEWTTSEGHKVLLPDREKIEQALEQLFTETGGALLASRPPVCPKIEGAETPGIEDDSRVRMWRELVGKSAGAYERREFQYPGDSSEVTVRMVFEPDGPVTGEGVGFVVYGPQGEVGKGQKTDKPGERELYFSSEESGTYTIQVHNYIEGLVMRYRLEWEQDPVSLRRLLAISMPWPDSTQEWKHVVCPRFGFLGRKPIGHAPASKRRLEAREPC